MVGLIHVGCKRSHHLARAGHFGGHLGTGSGGGSGSAGSRLLRGLLVATAGRQAQGDGQGKGGKAGRVQFHGHSIAGKSRRGRRMRL